MSQKVEKYGRETSVILRIQISWCARNAVPLYRLLFSPLIKNKHQTSGCCLQRENRRSFIDPPVSLSLLDEEALRSPFCDHCIYCMCEWLWGTEGSGYFLDLCFSVSVFCFFALISPLFRSRSTDPCRPCSDKERRWRLQMHPRRAPHSRKERFCTGDWMFSSL